LAKLESSSRRIKDGDDGDDNDGDKLVLRQGNFDGYSAAESGKSIFNSPISPDYVSLHPGYLAAEPVCPP